MKNLKDYLMNESLITEKLNYTSKATLKICKGFGFTENDEWTEVIDKWVKDNDVTNVELYTENMKFLKELHIPKSIINMYTSDPELVKQLSKELADNGKELAKDDEWFALIGNDKAMRFTSSGEEHSLYAVKI